MVQISIIANYLSIFYFYFCIIVFVFSSPVAILENDPDWSLDSDIMTSYFQQRRENKTVFDILFY